MFDDLIASLNRRLPAAPYESRSSFVEVAPWLAVLSAALGLILGGRGQLLLQLPQLIALGLIPSPILLAAVASPILAIASIQGLRKRTRLGWWLFAASVLIDFVFSLLRLDIFGIAFGAVFIYLLLQVYDQYGSRPRYRW